MKINIWFRKKNAVFLISVFFLYEIIKKKIKEFPKKKFENKINGIAFPEITQEEKISLLIRNFCITENIKKCKSSLFFT